MRHIEFYVLWKDKTWSVESIDVAYHHSEPDGVFIERARQLLESRNLIDIGSDLSLNRFEAVGPLYFIETVEQK